MSLTQVIQKKYRIHTLCVHGKQCNATHQTYNNQSSHVTSSFYLGSNFKVQYNDTITNLQSRLAEIIKYAREVNISTVFENKIPLNMAFEAIPLDINNKTLTGITVTSTDSIKSCNIDGTASQSTVKLNIKETTTGALDKLNALRFKITATKSTTIAALPLKTSQYFIMDIKVMIPDGLTLSFAK